MLIVKLSCQSIYLRRIKPVNSILLFISQYTSHSLHMKMMLLTHIPLRKHCVSCHRTEGLHSNIKFQIYKVRQVFSREMADTCRERGGWGIRISVNRVFQTIYAPAVPPIPWEAMFRLASFWIVTYSSDYLGIKSYTSDTSRVDDGELE